MLQLPTPTSSRVTAQLNAQLGKAAAQRARHAGRDCVRVGYPNLCREAAAVPAPCTP